MPAFSLLKNSTIAELLALESDRVRPPLQRAFRRAARRAFLWPQEVSELIRQKRRLTELSGVGPYLEKQIQAWLRKPPSVPEPPAIRAGFLSIPEAELQLSKNPEWQRLLKGDLQMHSTWSDGTGSIREMADAAVERGYEYIAITDHSKGLKIAGGIDEIKLR